MIEESTIYVTAISDENGTVDYRLSRSKIAQRLASPKARLGVMVFHLQIERKLVEAYNWLARHQDYVKMVINQKQLNPPVLVQEREIFELRIKEYQRLWTVPELPRKVYKITNNPELPELSRKVYKIGKPTNNPKFDIDYRKIDKIYKRWFGEH